MCQLIETIRIEEGEICNISFHERRLNEARLKLFGENVPVSISDFLRVPKMAMSGIIKCRLIYRQSIESVTFDPYIPVPVNTLKIVDGSDISYSCKYLDREQILRLISKDVADDILIVKNGFLSDISFANIVFTDGTRWVTPDTPLLRGTMRESLLQSGIIEEQRMTTESIALFTHFRIINAMLGFNAPLIPVKNIIF